jgi:hypothetical protein
MEKEHRLILMEIVTKENLNKESNAMGSLNNFQLENKLK